MNKIDNLKTGDRVECIKEIVAPEFKIEVGETCKVKDVFSTQGEPFLIFVELEKEEAEENIRFWTIVDKFKKIEGEVKKRGRLDSKS